MYTREKHHMMGPEGGAKSISNNNKPRVHGPCVLLSLYIYHTDGIGIARLFANETESFSPSVEYPYIIKEQAFFVSIL